MLTKDPGSETLPENVNPVVSVVKLSDKLVPLSSSFAKSGAEAGAFGAILSVTTVLVEEVIVEIGL
jgi:hypothetical protein